MSELVEVTDENGHTVDVVERSWARRSGLRVRITLTAILRDDGHLLCHRRADDRPTMAGLWDLAAGGAVAPGEDPDVSARREVLEELGIEIVCNPVWEGAWHHPGAPRWVHAFVARSSDEPVFDPVEVVEVAWLSRPEIEALARHDQVCPDSWELLWPRVRERTSAR
jgi:8-oxo-dGTP pyrophosphatase MutT (NUDIX family)